MRLCAPLLFAATLFVAALPVRANLALTDSDGLVVPNADYSSALGAWTLPFTPLPAHAALVVQACAAMRDNYTICPTASLSPVLPCDQVLAALQDPAWTTLARAVRDSACAVDAALPPAPGSPAVFAVPNDLRIAANATRLAAFAHDFGNNSFVFHMRAVLLRVVQGQAVVEHSAWTLPLSIPRPTFATLTLENECVHRGLLTPPLAVLTAHPRPDGTRPCIWTCNPSHVRQPFSKPPLPSTAAAPNASAPPYSPMCHPLPREYVAFVFDLTLYVDTADASLDANTANATAYVQHFHDAMDTFSSNIAARAHENGLPDALVLARIRGALYDTAPFRLMLQRHNLFSNILADLTIYEIASPTHAAQVTQSAQEDHVNQTAQNARRLLQDTTSTPSTTAVHVDGCLVTAAIQHVDAAAAFQYAELALAADLAFDPELRVLATSPVRISAILRSAGAATPRPLAVSVDTQRTIVFIMEGACILIILCRCALVTPHRSGGKHAASNV